MDNLPVALVTGANSGIGLAMTRALAEKGWRVYATFRNPRRARDLKNLSKTLPCSLPMDVDKTPSVKKAVSSLVKKEGRLDFLMNNAVS